MYMKKDKMVEKILRNLILKQNQRSGFKIFHIGYINLLFVKNEFCFLGGQLHKKL